MITVVIIAVTMVHVLNINHIMEMNIGIVNVISDGMGNTVHFNTLVSIKLYSL